MSSLAWYSVRLAFDGFMLCVFLHVAITGQFPFRRRPGAK